MSSGQPRELPGQARPLGAEALGAGVADGVAEPGAAGGGAPASPGVPGAAEALGASPELVAAAPRRHPPSAALTTMRAMSGAQRRMRLA